MSKIIKLIQTLHEKKIGSDFINKLYTMIHKKQDLNEETINMESSDFVGEITLNGPTYEEYVEYINTYFPNLTINVSEYYIMVEDPEMLRILMTLNMSGDGIGLVQADFDKITSLNAINDQMNHNENLVDTRILGKFTNLQSTNWNFYGGPFCNCINLKYAAVPKVPMTTLTKQMYYTEGMFEGCTKLEYVKFYTTTLTTLGSKSFYGCTNPNLKIDLNNTNHITRIEDRVFIGCRFRDLEECIINYNFNKLEYISGLAGNTNLEIIRIRSGIKEIGSEAFQQCSNLRTFIVDENGADITLNGAGVYGPGGCMFYQTNIDVINWHKRVKQINGKTGGFTGNISTKMIFENETPPTATEVPFRHFLGKIYVPDASLQDYKTATGWSSAADKIYGISEYTE